MWNTWFALLVSCALVGAETEVSAAGPAATTRAPLRTLDRKASELAWQTWLPSPESGNPNATHRRITTKSLFITPLICPKGQQLHRDGCIQVVTVEKDEHQRNLLHELNALFTVAPNNGDVVYDYGDEEQGPLQLSIPIGLDPQALPQELNAQAQNLQQNYIKMDNKGDSLPNTGASIEAELELLKLQVQNKHNNTVPQGNILAHNGLNNLLSYSDKPKRDSPMINATNITDNSTDKGQEEHFFGQVNIDPVIYDTQNQDDKDVIDPVPETKDDDEIRIISNTEQITVSVNNVTNNASSSTQNLTTIDSKPVPIELLQPIQPLKAAALQTKLNPENEYSDIGEAIKLISRYADVSTDDIFPKDQRTGTTEDSILGTRTKLQYRRNRPKVSENLKEAPVESPDNGNTRTKDNKLVDNIRLHGAEFYRYPWQSQNSATPPPHYPFRHLQDYWPGRNYVGGVYNSVHENPRRHHHSYPHYFRPRSYPSADLTQSRSVVQEPYPGFRHYPHNIVNRASPIRSHQNNQDLYSLLGLRHWFGSEGASKR